FVLLPDKRTLAETHETFAAVRDLVTEKLIYQSKGWAPPSLLGNNWRRVFAHCSPDGKTLLATFPGKVKRVEKGDGRKKEEDVYWTMIGQWDFRTNKMTNAFQVDAEDLRDLYLCPDGKTAAGYGRLPEYQNSKIVFFVWDLRSGKELRR